MNFRTYIKNLRYWCLPVGVENLLRNCVSGLNLPRKLRKMLSGNEKFRGCHKNERCFILATGPSVNSQDLTVLQNEICISVAEFYHHKDFKTINPMYHVEAPSHDPFDNLTITGIVNNLKKFLICELEQSIFRLTLWP